MVGAWQQNLEDRANYVVDYGKEASLQTKLHVSMIRAAGGLPSALGSNSSHPCAQPLYKAEELDDVLGRLPVGKRCLGMPYAALKASCPAGRRLTIALANLGL